MIDLIGQLKEQFRQREIKYGQRRQIDERYHTLLKLEEEANRMTHQLTRERMPDSVLNAIVIQEYLDGRLHVAQLEEQALDQAELYMPLPEQYIDQETREYNCARCDDLTEWVQGDNYIEGGIRMGTLYHCTGCGTSQMKDVDEDAMHELKNRLMGKLDYLQREELHDEYMLGIPFGD